MQDPHCLQRVGLVVFVESAYKDNEKRFCNLLSLLMLKFFLRLCHVPHQILLAHPVGQNILVNNGVLSIIMDLVLQEVDTKLSVSINFAMSFNYLKILAV